MMRHVSPYERVAPGGTSPPMPQPAIRRSRRRSESRQHTASDNSPNVNRASAGGPADDRRGEDSSFRRDRVRRRMHPPRSFRLPRAAAIAALVTTRVPARSHPTRPVPQAVMSDPGGGVPSILFEPRGYVDGAPPPEQSISERLRRALSDHFRSVPQWPRCRSNRSTLLALVSAPFVVSARIQVRMSVTLLAVASNQRDRTLNERFVWPPVLERVLMLDRQPHRHGCSAARLEVVAVLLKGTLRPASAPCRATD